MRVTAAAPQRFVRVPTPTYLLCTGVLTVPVDLPHVFFHEPQLADTHISRRRREDRIARAYRAYILHALEEGDVRGAVIGEAGDAAAAEREHLRIGRREAQGCDGDRTEHGIVCGVGGRVVDGGRRDGHGQCGGGLGGGHEDAKGRDKLVIMGIMVRVKTNKVLDTYELVDDEATTNYYA